MFITSSSYRTSPNCEVARRTKPYPITSLFTLFVRIRAQWQPANHARFLAPLRPRVAYAVAVRGELRVLRGQQLLQFAFSAPRPAEEATAVVHEGHEGTRRKA